MTTRQVPLLIGLLVAGRSVLGSERGRFVTVTVRGPHMPAGVPTQVVLPPGWSPGQPAVLMVFLHDGWGNENSFRRHGLANLAVGMMQGRALPPTIIASPRHRGTFITDSPRGAMESFVADGLVPALEREFPGAGGSRERRVVWGISMGGYGALKMALRHPDAYGRAGALAPWVMPLSWDAFERGRNWLGRHLLEPVFGRTREDNRFDSNNLFNILAHADPTRVPGLIIRTGSRDKWERGAQQLVSALRGRGVDVDAASVEGAKHRWSDWRRSAPVVMRFLVGNAEPQ